MQHLSDPRARLAVTGLSAIGLSYVVGSLAYAVTVVAGSTSALVFAFGMALMAAPAAVLAGNQLVGAEIRNPRLYPFMIGAQSALLATATVLPWAMQMAMHAGQPWTPAEETAFLPTVLALMATASVGGLLAGFRIRSA